MGPRRVGDGDDRGVFEATFHRDCVEPFGDFRNASDWLQVVLRGNFLRNDAGYDDHPLSGLTEDFQDGAVFELMSCVGMNILVVKPLLEALASTSYSGSVITSEPH